MSRANQTITSSKQLIECGWSHGPGIHCLEGLAAKARQSRSVLLGIIVYTNILDYLLLTAVVPIIPQFLLQEDKEKTVENIIHSGNTTSSALLFENDGDFVVLLNETTFRNVSGALHNVTSESFIQRILHVPIRAISENSAVGWLLSSKALVQMIANPVIGTLSNRVSYRQMLLFGTCIFLVSATMFAAAGSYVPLLLARAVHGLGSAATLISGMSMIAEHYPDDAERSRAMGTALGGQAFGILIGSPFGGLLFAVLGKAAPFLGICLLCMINIALQAELIGKTDVSGFVESKSSSLITLLKDPYILISAELGVFVIEWPFLVGTTCAILYSTRKQGAIMTTSMAMAVLESTVPLWVIDTMDAQQWQLALIFIPDSLGYLIGTYGFPAIALKYGRWIFTICAMLLMGVGTIVIPFSTKLIYVLLPNMCLGLGVGITDAALMPLLALLVDQRHVSAYGSVYAIVQLSVCLGMALGVSRRQCPKPPFLATRLIFNTVRAMVASFTGPAAGGQVAKALGFKWAMWGMAVLNMGFAPVCYLLRSPPGMDDHQAILDDVEPDQELQNSEEDHLYPHKTYPNFGTTE